MNKFFKSRFFIVTLIIAMLLCIMPATLALMGQGSFVRSVAVTVVSPFQHAASYIGESLGGFARYFTHYDELKEENERLKQQLAEQRQENYEANLYKAENEWLKDYLELKRVNSSLELVDARVIGRETTNTRIIYTLDRGSSAGITKNMPIITAEGVVGHIVEVGLTWSKAVTLSDGRSNVGVYAERSGEIGVLSGDYELTLDGKCEMICSDSSADVAVGDRIMTSGIGSVYPEGLPVGAVTEVRVDEYDRSLRVTVQPFVDFESVTGVMVVCGFSHEGGE